MRLLLEVADLQRLAKMMELCAIGFGEGLRAVEFGSMPAWKPSLTGNRNDCFAAGFSQMSFKKKTTKKTPRASFKLDSKYSRLTK